MHCAVFSYKRYSVSNFQFTGNNGNTSPRSEICSKLFIIKILKVKEGLLEACDFTKTKRLSKVLQDTFQKLLSVAFVVSS